MGHNGQLGQVRPGSAVDDKGAQYDEHQGGGASPPHQRTQPPSRAIPQGNPGGCRGDRDRHEQQETGDQVGSDRGRRVVGEHRDRAEHDLNDDHPTRYQGGKAHPATAGPLPQRADRRHCDQHGDHCHQVAVTLLQQGMESINGSEGSVAQRPARAAHSRLSHPYRTAEDHQQAGDNRGSGSDPAQSGSDGGSDRRCGRSAVGASRHGSMVGEAERTVHAVAGGTGAGIA